jgi:hypothetical protein
MSKTTLTKLIESEVRKVLTEAITEPSEQILKGAVDIFRQQTGINVATPTLISKDSRSVSYSVSLDKEIRTNIMKALFNSLSLEVIAVPLQNSIGGFRFNFFLNYKHPGERESSMSIGRVDFKNNKYVTRF